MRVIGADVSHWENIINWVTATPSLAFAYYKATDGEDFIDSQFGNNQDGCDETGLPHAPYHWWQELEDPEVQAHHFVETTQGTYKKRIVDVEPRVTFPGIVDKLERHLHKIEDLQGFKPAIYSSKNYWNNYIKPNPPWASEYDFIIAQYSYRLTLIPAYVPKATFWQFTDEFYFPGCNSEADGNWFFGSLSECRNWFGNYHPFVPPIPGGKTQLRVIASVLNIREQPNAKARVLGALANGDIIEVEDIGGYNAWVKHARGWSAYTTSGYKYLEPV